MVVSTAISVIVPTWRNLEMLELCLASVNAHSELSPQVVVHVNDGSDGTLRWVRENGVEHTSSTSNV